MMIKMRFDSSKHCRFFHEWWTKFMHIDEKGSAIYKECIDCGSRKVEIKGEVDKEMIDVEWGCGVIKEVCN